MTAFAKHDTSAPGFLAQAPSFSYFDPAEIHAFAPESYEQWRLAAIVPVFEGWYFHQPTLELLPGRTVDDVLQMVDHTRDGLKEQARKFDYVKWEAKWKGNRSWWAIW